MSSYTILFTSSFNAKGLVSKEQILYKKSGASAPLQFVAIIVIS